jgi:hypothetical protein
MSGLREGLAGAERDVEVSVTSAMREASGLMKDDARAQVVAAGLGPRLGRTWRNRTYPSGGRTSIDAAGWVWTKAPKLIDAFDRGVTIRSQHGFWLAIPTEAAGGGLKRTAGREARVTPGGFERRTGIRLRFIYRRGKPSLLVADNARLNARGFAQANTGRSRRGGTYTRLQGRTTVVVFILVPQVKLRKRLDLVALEARAAVRWPGLLTKHWRA